MIWLLFLLICSYVSTVPTDMADLQYDMAPAPTDMFLLFLFLLLLAACGKFPMTFLLEFRATFSLTYKAPLYSAPNFINKLVFTDQIVKT